MGPTKLHRFSKVETLPQVCLERDLTMKDGQGDAAININKTTLVNSSIVHNRCISLKKKSMMLFKNLNPKHPD